MALASAFQVPKTSMTHSLASLEKRGLVEMRPNLEDGRSKQVWLTAAGKSFREASIAGLMEDMTRLQSKLDVAQMIEVVPTLSKVRKVLDEDRE